MKTRLYTYIIIYNVLLMYGLSYWFYQLFRFICGIKEFRKGIFSTYSLEAAGINIYPLIPTISVAIAVYLLLSVRKMVKAV